MNKHRWLLGSLLLGCAGSPQDAVDELENSFTHPEEWCGYEHNKPQPIDVDKIFLPDGYGFTGDSTGCAALGSWPGGYCYIPLVTDQYWRLHQGTQDNTWFKKSTDEYGATASGLADLGWTLTRVSSGYTDVDVQTGTTSPNGWLGNGIPSNYLTVADSQGEIRLFQDCTAILYRTAIEANWAYQAASDTQRDKYLKNLWQHEYGHCLGLPHNGVYDTLMSAGYAFPGPYFNSNLGFSAAERNRLEAYADNN